jgi:hypothetical protein
MFSCVATRNAGEGTHGASGCHPRPSTASASTVASGKIRGLTATSLDHQRIRNTPLFSNSYLHVTVTLFTYMSSETILTIL